jgi:oxygen-independent coproporphyrinogen-3 oxidase
LPNETAEDVEKTLKGVLSLNPEGVTAHVLYNKRASEMSAGEAEANPHAAEMTDLTARLCKDAGVLPYYMYRQKNQLGNLENVGYAKNGRECLYNIIMMEETQTVIAAGAGAATKTVDGERITRDFNSKGIEEYIKCRLFHHSTVLL